MHEIKLKFRKGTICIFACRTYIARQKKNNYQSKSRRSTCVGNNTSFYFKMSVILTRPSIRTEILFNSTNNVSPFKRGHRGIRHVEVANYMTW